MVDFTFIFMLVKNSQGPHYVLFATVSEFWVSKQFRFRKKKINGLKKIKS